VSIRGWNSVGTSHIFQFSLIWKKKKKKFVHFVIMHNANQRVGNEDDQEICLKSSPAFESKQENPHTD